MADMLDTILHWVFPVDCAAGNSALALQELDGNVFDESLQRASFLPNHVTSDVEMRTPARAV